MVVLALSGSDEGTRSVHPDLGGGTVHEYGGGRSWWWRRMAEDGAEASVKNSRRLRRMPLEATVERARRGGTRRRRDVDLDTGN